MIDFKDIEDKVDEFLATLPCQSQLPFPEGEVERKNINYANMILDAYASSADSEIQAITQYLYHHKTIDNKTISNTLLCIALVEMAHLDVLGDIISSLGGKPAYYNSNQNFWMTGNIPYGDKDMLVVKMDEDNMKSKEVIKQKLMLNIKGEINAINGYKFLMQNVNDKYIKRVIHKIISDEEVHIEIFQSLIEKYL
ncbi:ferritin-like domain-containing protein [Clostridium sp.]|uniref:ferritin-like domain-containing protein n=1 Tax=Clostridium sp. TaxID=1506 RepID=UPI00321797DB